MMARGGGSSRLTKIAANTAKGETSLRTKRYEARPSVRNRTENLG